VGPLSTKSTAAGRASLAVYDFNINQMRLQWRGWIEHIRGSDLPAPDLILLQDVDSDNQRKELQAALASAFGGAFEGRGSEPPWQSSIMWRSARFERARHRAWKGWGHPVGKPGCIERGEGAPAVQVRLFDKKAKKWISAVSFKTPGKAGEDCVAKNMTKVHGALMDPAWTGSVLFMGTDANFSDYGEDRLWRPWYRGTMAALGASTRGNLGYRDPIFERCKGDQKELEAYRSLGHRRIDYLFFKRIRGREPRVLSADMLPVGEGGAKRQRWSDHRSVYALIDY
jgi:hypothetical protein